MNQPFAQTFRDSGMDALLALSRQNAGRIDAGLPASSDTAFAYVRALIDRNLIGENTVLAVSTDADETHIRRTFDAVRGAACIAVRLIGKDDGAADLKAARLMFDLAQECGPIRFAYAPVSFSNPYYPEILTALRGPQNQPVDLDLSALTAASASEESGSGASCMMSMRFGYHLPAAVQQEFDAAAAAMEAKLHRELDPDEVFTLFEQSFLNIRQPYALSRAKFYEEAVAGSSANITHFSGVLNVRGNFLQLDARGNGPIDAFFSALKQAGIDGYSFIAYHEHAISKGADSQAVAYIQLLAPGGVQICGVGTEHNINFASVKGILCAINRFENNNA